MAERDQIHQSVVTALKKDGWIITDDPLRIPTGGTIIKIDLGAERVITAERGEEKIAVEIKSLVTPSIVYSFYETFGQYMLYRDGLNDEGIDREIFLALSDIAFNRIAGVPFLFKRFQQYSIKAVVINVDQQSIVQWIK